ncbi:MAG TPA: YjjG family noncanonical pyrimidine nucleotidase [Cyclobacteriaceae bacterium]
MNYKCIFFDLDHTLWDYETNSSETLKELYDSFSLADRGVTSPDHFCVQFKKINFQLWDLYDRGLITSEVIRKERFKQVLEPFGAHEEQFSDHLSKVYLQNCPLKGHLLPNALETVQYLSEKYSLTIVTNGFEEIQPVKVASGKLTPYFNHIITSQKAGHKKPAREIFEYAMKLNGIQPHESIMIGDNLLTDMAGARNATIDTVFFNPEAIPHHDQVNHEIQDLKELRSIL